MASRANPTSAALAVLLLSAALFASAPAWAQDQGHATEDQHQEQTEDHGQTTGHSEGQGEETAHGETAHAADTAHGETGEHGEGEHGGGHGGMPHLPNALTFLESWLPGGAAQVLVDYKDPIFSLFVALLLALFFVGLSGRLDARRPGRRQMAAEMLLGGLSSLFETIIGPTYRRYTPYLGTLFIFIFANNLFGLVPLGHSSTSSFANTTFALGLMTFVYVQAIALKENGVGGYLHHLAGSPKSTLDWCLVPLFFPLHVIGELIKPVSLSLRLFGNIFGEDTLVATMVLLGAGISYSLSGNAWWVPGLPFQFPFYFLGLLSCTIQALVFTLLSTVYIALWLPHGHEAEGH